MQIIDIVLAFFAGMFACCMGSVWVFILCALTSLVGVVSGNPMFVAIAFGPLLNPATTFLAGCVASGYANMRGYGPATVVDMLVKLR